MMLTAAPRRGKARHHRVRGGAERGQGHGMEMMSET